MAAPWPHRFSAAWRGEALFCVISWFDASMGSTLGGLCVSRFYLAWIILLFQGRLFLMIVGAHAILYPLSLLGSVASMQPNYISAGNSVSEGC